MAADLLPKLILIADDDPDDLELLTHTIKKLQPSYDILRAENGQEVLSHLDILKKAGRFPCFIILDMNMPLIGGQETIKYIKRDMQLRYIPIVIFTTSPAERYIDILAAYDVGIFQKPARLHELEMEVSKMLAYCNQKGSR